MPDLAAAELSIPAEQIPDPAKPLVVPVDSTVVASTRRSFHGWRWAIQPFPTSSLLLQGCKRPWVQIPQWVAISGFAFLPFVELEPATAPYFEGLSVLQLSILATSWRRILGALADLGVLAQTRSA